MQVSWHVLEVKGQLLVLAFFYFYMGSTDGNQDDKRYLSGPQTALKALILLQL